MLSEGACAGALQLQHAPAEMLRHLTSKSVYNQLKAYDIYNIWWLITEYLIANNFVNNHKHIAKYVFVTFCKQNRDFYSFLCKYECKNGTPGGTTMPIMVYIKKKTELNIY